MRVIPRIDVRGPNVIKGIHLEGVRIVGKPNEMALKYAADGADEILFMDVVASLYGRDNILSVVREAARDIFIPLTVGGGIRTIDDVVATLRSGADKVAVNTAAIENPDFLSRAARSLGSQCMVVSIEAKRQGDWWEAFTHNGREHTGRDVLDWASEAEQLGAGEILLTSMDRDGTKEGFELTLTSAVADRLAVPVIASGGVGTLDHLVAGVRQGHASAVLAASIFHFGTYSIAQAKAHMQAAGVAVRP